MGRGGMMSSSSEGCSCRIRFCYAACILALGLVPRAWAINKCTDAQGKVSFQEAPCPGEGREDRGAPRHAGACRRTAPAKP